MRILFTFVGGHGHFEPLAPIARAAEAAGYAVAFGCAPSMISTVEAAEFFAFAMGIGASRPPGRPEGRCRTGMGAHAQDRRSVHWFLARGRLHPRLVLGVRFVPGCLA